MDAQDVIHETFQVSGQRERHIWQFASCRAQATFPAGGPTCLRLIGRSRLTLTLSIDTLALRPWEPVFMVRHMQLHSKSVIHCNCSILLIEDACFTCASV